MVATVTASYFLLTADYGPEPNALDPVCFSFIYIYIFAVVHVQSAFKWSIRFWMV
jgi:hypothetical protein